jgi:hypothetical protein
MDKKCLVCDKMYHAERSTSKFCSAKCRKAYSRDIKDEPEVEVKTVQQVVPKNEWDNSAETKTQAEIEEHYTLANFPPVKYYSQNGGGSGSRSPYPMSDPRSIPYV